MTTKSRSEKSLAATPIKCDRCGKVEVCLYTYEDPNEDYLAMIFCGLDCLAAYVRASEVSAKVFAGGEADTAIN